MEEGNITIAEVQLMKKCAFCGEEIQGTAVICRFCGRDLRTKVSVARVIAKTIHSLAFGWTAFCGVGVLMGMIGVAASGATSSTAGAIGATIGLGLWAAIWFVPVVAGEIIAIGIAMTARKVQNTPEINRREWWLGGAISAVPNGVLILALLPTLGGHKTQAAATQPLGISPGLANTSVASEPKTADRFEIVLIDSRVTESNSVWSKFAWKLVSRTKAIDRLAVEQPLSFLTKTISSWTTTLSTTWSWLQIKTTPSRATI